MGKLWLNVSPISNHERNELVHQDFRSQERWIGGGRGVVFANFIEVFSEGSKKRFRCCSFSLSLHFTNLLDITLVERSSRSLRKLRLISQILVFSIRASIIRFGSPASVYSRPKEISLIKEWHRLRNCNHSQAVNSEGDIDQGEIVQKTRRNASG